MEGWMLLAAVAVVITISGFVQSSMGFGYAVVLSVMKAVGLIVTGWTDRTLLLYTAAAIPFGFVGSQIGIMASRNINPRRFRQITMSVLVVLSIAMILRGQPNSNESSPSPTAVHTQGQSSAEATR